MDFLKKIGSLHEIGIKGNFMDTEKITNELLNDLEDKIRIFGWSKLLSLTHNLRI